MTAWSLINSHKIQFALAIVILFICTPKCCRGFQFPATGLACIIVNMDAEISVTQLGSNPIKVSSNLSKANTDNGRCAEGSDSAANLALQTTGDLPMTINFLFSKDEESTVFMDISVTFNPDAVFKNNDTDIQIHVDEGNTRLSKDTASYQCESQRTVPFNIKNSTMFSYEVKITTSNVEIQAFNIINGSLSKAEECSDEMTSEGPTTLEPNFTTIIESTTVEANPSTEQISTIELTTSTTGTSEAPSTPKPNNPPVKTYSVTGQNGTCIMISCGIQFQVPYNSSETMETKTLGVPGSNAVSFDGSCDKPNNTQDVTIKFYEGWKVTMTFRKENDYNTEKYYLSQIDLTANLSRELFPDIDTPIFIQDMKKEFGTNTIRASEDGSYKCIEESSFALQNGFIMNTYNLQYAAFQQNITGFSDKDLTECSSDIETHSYIPIAVGASLGGLILIVLVAYIIGRRCESKGGYDTLH